MLGFMDRFKDDAYALLRIASGFMFAFHGCQKVFGLYSDFHPAFGSQIWIGGWMEVLGGLAILLGFWTRIAAFLCSGEMAVAYVQFHWKGQLDRNIFPSLNHGESALLYSLVFLLICAQGPGKWSLDREP